MELENRDASSESSSASLGAQHPNAADLQARVGLGLFDPGEFSPPAPAADAHLVLQMPPQDDKEATELAERLHDCLLQSIEGKEKEVRNLIDSFAHSDQSIRLSPPATASFLRGALAGGCTAYLLSFYTAKVLTLAFVQIGETSRWAFAPLAGVLHATLGEVVGGGLRATYATYQSPDGALWADLVSAMSNYAVCTVGGDVKGRQRARQAMDRATQNIQGSLNKRLGVDLTRSDSIAAFGAWWRSLVCDELAFVAFALTYVVTGGIQPLLRRMEDQPLSRGIDFSATLVCGLLGGSLTGVIQNATRRHLQRAAFATGGNHNAERAAREALLSATIEALENKRNQIQHTSQKYLSGFASAQTGPAARVGPSIDAIQQAMVRKTNEALALIDSALEATRLDLARLEAQEGVTPTLQAIGRTAQNLFCAPANTNTPWVGRAAKLRRALAKSIGNTAAVAAYLYYMQTVSSALHPLATSPIANQTDVPQPEPFPGHSPHPPIDGMEVIDFALHGFVLIGAWCTRTVLSNATEMIGLSVLPGVGLRVGKAAKALLGWAGCLGSVAPTSATGNAGEVTQAKAVTAPDGDRDSSESTIGSEDEHPSSDDTNSPSGNETTLEEELADASQVVVDMTAVREALQPRPPETSSSSLGD